MMNSTQNISDWLFLTVVLLSIGLMLGLIIWEAILEIQYIDPFVLIKTNNKVKWRRATILALLLTSMLPTFGLVMSIIGAPYEKLPMFLLCNGVWIIVFPLAILYKRWEFEMHIKRYRFFDEMIKDNNSVYYRFLKSKFPTRFMKMFLSAEQKRFYREGFPDDNDDKKDGMSSSQE
ncbi:MAG: hypothetical protein M1282_17085 [Chloroflexi bacterium]|nr:hypothetical protein [Chloroflexota bacterium]